MVPHLRAHLPDRHVDRHRRSRHHVLVIDIPGHPDHDADERVGHIYTPLGATLREVPHCVAGDICAITKSNAAETGDTLSTKDMPLLVEPWDMPEPLLPIAVQPRAKTDVATMVGANVGVSMPVFWLAALLSERTALVEERANEVVTPPVRVAPEQREPFATPPPPS